MESRNRDRDGKERRKEEEVKGGNSVSIETTGVSHNREPSPAAPGPDLTDDTAAERARHYRGDCAIPAASVRPGSSRLCSGGRKNGHPWGRVVTGEAGGCWEYSTILISLMVRGAATYVRIYQTVT